jgi:two-component system, chemotaxis family, CheB/CheR fusion protein
MVIRSEDGDRPYQPRYHIGPFLTGEYLWIGYLLAVLVPLLTMVARLALVPALGSGSPLLPFYLATLLVVVLAGRGAALVCVAISPFCASWIALETYDSVGSWQWAAHFGLFLLTSLLMIALADIAQRSHAAQRAHLAASQRAERAALEAAAQMRLIADALPALIAYIGRDLRYRFNNRNYQTWFGADLTALDGQQVNDVLGEQAFAALFPSMQQALEGHAVHFEGSVAYRDGGQRYVSADYIPDVDRTGEVRGFFALVQDMSERRRTEQALEEARQTLSLALRAGQSGTFDWNVRKNINTWSEELLALHGIAPEQFAGTHEAWLEVLHPDDRQRVVGLVVRALEEGTGRGEYRIIRRDNGEARWMHGRAKVFYDEFGLPVRMLGINVDITERILAEEGLRLAAKRKDEFLAMLAHELRNPLAPIRSAAHILSERSDDVTIVRKMGQVVDRQSALLTRLVDDLLDVARITRGMIELRRSELNIEAAIDAALESVQPMLARKSQQVSVTRPPPALCVCGDHDRLCQVFANLINNACRYSPEHALIQVVIEHEPAWVVVRVCDEGQGIEAQLLPHVFDLFTQGDRALTRSESGLGLGLTIVKQIVTMHGGSVEGRSTGLGQGSEFIVRLPRAA